MDMDNWKGFSDEDIRRHALSLQSADCLEKKSEHNQDNQLMKLKIPHEQQKTHPIAIRKDKTLESGNAFSRSYDCIVTSDMKSASEQCGICIQEDCCNKYLCASDMLDARKEKLQQLSDVDIDNVKISSRNRISAVANLQPSELAFEKSKKSSALEEFEKRQKQIEADNAKFKAIIAKTLVDRKKRTEAEVLRLEKIQEELKRLDLSLSDDVSVLRKLIEQSSIEFYEAEKRYYKAEKEFVAAKIVLFKVMDKKEKLTEHLCKIIEQNENHKAHRLHELMQQLEVEVESFDEMHKSTVLEEPKLSELNTNSSECHSTEFLE